MLPLGRIHHQHAFSGPGLRYDRQEHCSKAGTESGMYDNGCSAKSRDSRSAGFVLAFHKCTVCQDPFIGFCGRHPSEWTCNYTTVRSWGSLLNINSLMTTAYNGTCRNKNATRGSWPYYWEQERSKCESHEVTGSSRPALQLGRILKYSDGMLDLGT